MTQKCDGDRATSLATRKRCPKKVSGRWGDRPLGRGDGGKRNPKLVQFFLSYRCAREPQYGTQEQFQLPRKPRPTPDHNAILLPTFVSVDSPLVPSSRYFPRHAFVLFPRYLRTLAPFLSRRTCSFRKIRGAFAVFALPTSTAGILGHRESLLSKLWLGSIGSSVLRDRLDCLP